MSISGASALTRFLRTAPDWEQQVRSWFNPAALEWKTKAITGSDYYKLAVAVNPSTFPLTPTGYKFTIGGWFKPTVNTTDGLMSFFDGTNNAIGLKIKSGTNQIFVQHGTSTGYSGQTITPNTWNHIMWSQYDQYFDIWVNGVVWTYQVSSAPDLSTITEWRLGECDGDFFEGLMSDIWVANTWMPTAPEAATIYNNGAAFSMSQNVVAPINPARAATTAYWDGTDTGTQKFLAPAKSSGNMPAFTDATLEWSGNLSTCPILNSASRPASISNTYTRLSELAYLWGRGDTVGGLTALGSGVSLEAASPALLPYPYTGWGVKTDSSSIVGAVDYPLQTPQLTASGTLAEPNMESNPTIGTNTFQGVLDAREVRVLRPTFARKV